MLKTTRVKTRKLYLFHVLWSVRILFEQATYVVVLGRNKSFEPIMLNLGTRRK